MFVYVQSDSREILREADGWVYNMALHGEKWIKEIKRAKKPFLLVHGGFQRKMAKIEEIVEFAREHKPKLVIAPDVYREHEVTLFLTGLFVEKCPELVEKSAAVIQGGVEVLEETVKQYDEWGFEWLAIPSDNPVIELIEWFKEQGWRIHVLGARFTSFPVGADSVDVVVSKYEQDMLKVLRWL